MLESMCQGQFMYKEPNEAWQFLEDLAEKNLQWETTREPERSIQLRGGLHQVPTSLAAEAKIATLTRRLEALELQRPANVNQVSSSRCSGCNAPGHILEDCPLLVNPTENGCAQVNVSYQRPVNNPYAPTYNPGWRNHPNFSWSQNPNVGGSSFSQQNPRPNPVLNNPPGFNNNEKRLDSLEKSLEVLAKSNVDTNATLNNFMQTTSQLLNSNTQAIARLEMQVGQLASNMSEREKGRLPSQPEVNPRTQNNQQLHCGAQINQLNAIHKLRSGKQLDNHESIPERIPETEDPLSQPLSDQDQPEKPKEAEHEAAEALPELDGLRQNVVAPFPNRLKFNRNTAQLDKMLEVFKQVKINIPLLDMIQQIPAYAKFLKDLCTKKKTTNVPKRAFLAASVSSYLMNHMPVKYKDPGSPTISCVVGKTLIDKALLDLGASVNILPYSVYKKLELGDLKPTGMTLQLADRSLKLPKGIVEDVLIKVGDFIYPIDFVILETEPVTNPNGHIPVILGRPFLATANAQINCRNGLMKLSFGNMSIDLNIFDLTETDKGSDQDWKQENINEPIDLSNEESDKEFFMNQENKKIKEVNEIATENREPRWEPLVETGGVDISI